MTELTNTLNAYKRLVITASVFFIAWAIFAFQGLASAIGIWWGNEIYNHCFLILPSAIYLVYLKRGRWLQNTIAGSWLGLPFLLLGVLLYVVGYAGDIQLFMHTAAFGLLPVLGWTLLGNKVAWALLFPFCFILFSIPVGDQLIPWLQEVTADMSVAMLQFSGIPLFRSGLYIEIPQGRFLVAEACSGISFFIVSIVFGSFYAYLNFKSTKKRLGFFALSVIYPILANAIRVYGIILVGYWSDMEHAVGADHLIYGWFFFAFVLITLLGIGEWLRDKDAEWAVPVEASLGTQQASKASVPYALAVSVVVVFLLGFAWMRFIDAQQRTSALESPQLVALPQGFTPLNTPDYLDYKPELKRVTKAHFYTKKSVSALPAVVVQAWFNGKDGELVSGLHRLYGEQEWSLIEQYVLSFQGAATEIRVKLISNPLGAKRLVASWYVVQGKVFTDDTKTKLYQTVQVLKGKGSAGLRVIASVPVSQGAEGLDDANRQLSALVEELIGKGRM